MSDNLIRCVHENGKVCFLTKEATENRAFMKKYGIRVEHVAKKEPIQNVNIAIDTTEVKQVLDNAIKEASASIEHHVEKEVEAIDAQIAEALAEVAKPVKPKQTRKPRKPTKR